MGRGRRQRTGGSQERSVDVDVKGGSVDEWWAVTALEVALASHPRDQALLDLALPARDLASVAHTVGLELDDEMLSDIRGRVMRALSTIRDADASAMLAMARATARRMAAAELALLIAADGPERAHRLGYKQPMRRERPALSSHETWAQLIASNWTNLPLFTRSHFHGYFTRLLARRPSLLERAARAIAHSPSGGASGGAEATAVLAATTAASAD